MVSIISGLFVILLTYAVVLVMMSRPDMMEGYYTSGQIRGAVEELAFYMLRARDRKMTGIAKGGAVHMLSNDLLRAALYNSGMVDSDDDLDDLDALRETLRKRSKSGKDSRASKRVSANIMALTSDFTDDHIPFQSPVTGKEGKKKAVISHADVKIPGIKNPLAGGDSDDEGLGRL